MPIKTLLIVMTISIGSTIAAIAQIDRNGSECHGGDSGVLCPIPTQIQKPQKIGNIIYYPYLKVRDNSGKSAEISLALLSDRYRWELGSADRLGLKDSKQTWPISKLQSELKQQGITKAMANPDRIIAIGVAACSGTKINEENLAKNRAIAIRDRLVKPLFKVKNLSVLNLGKFTSNKCTDASLTSWQGGLAIMGVRRAEAGSSLKEAIYNRLDRTIEGFKSNDYSLGGKNKLELK